MTYLQAISDGLRSEMRHDERVLVMGEDIGVFGGAFKVTDGFIEEFGAGRVMDTPLAESGIIGTAVGAAVVGLRPVCEMQFADFISCGFDQLVNVAGKMHYRQGLPVNITVRLPSGGGFSGGPFHSQNPEAWFMHAPGLKVVAPSHRRGRQGPAHRRDPRPQPGRLPRAQAPLPPREGRGRPTARYDDAVHRARRARGHRPDGHRLRRDGPHRAGGDRGPRRRVGRGARPALARAARRGGDPRLACARRSKVAVVDEANATCAAGAQVAALIAEQGFEDLDGPVVPRGDARRARSRSRRRSSRRSCPASTRVKEAAVSSSSTETLDRRRRCPRWASRSPRARSSSGASSAGDWVEHEETLVRRSRRTRSTPRSRRRRPGGVAEILVEVGDDRRGRHRARADRDRRQARARRTPPSSTAPPTREAAAGHGETPAERPATPLPTRHADAGRRAAPAAGARRAAATRRSCSASRPSTASTSTRSQGTGRGGRVRKQDVLAFLERRRRRRGGRGAAAAHRVALPARPVPRAAPPTPRARRPAPRRSRRQPPGALSRMRSSIGEHMKRSLDTAAHVHDVDRGRHARRRARARASSA